MTEMTPAVAALIDLALEEDLGRGDVTTSAVLDPRAQAEGDLVARERLVLAGLSVAAAVFQRVDRTVSCQLLAALQAGADIVLLDNFSAADVEEAMGRVRARSPRPLVEVSGGVTLARLPELARAGVDLASVGALTHSARAVDLSLDIRVRA